MGSPEGVYGGRLCKPVGSLQLAISDAKDCVVDLVRTRTSLPHNLRITDP